MKRSWRAFTLFEVLVALGVFAVAVIGLVSALNGVLTAAGEARRAQLVRTQLENRLALLEGGELKELERKVEIESPRMTIAETVRREQVTGSRREILQGFWRVTIVASWKEAGQDRSETVSILRFSP